MRWIRITLWNGEGLVPKKVEQINDHFFIDTYKSNNIKIGVNDMPVNDRKCVWDEMTKLG